MTTEKKILWVDDDEAMRAYMPFLEGAGLHVLFYQKVDDAIAQFGKARFALVIWDDMIRVGSVLGSGISLEDERRCFGGSVFHDWVIAQEPYQMTLLYTHNSRIIRDHLRPDKRRLARLKSVDTPSSFAQFVCDLLSL